MGCIYSLPKYMTLNGVKNSFKKSVQNSDRIRDVRGQNLNVGLSWEAKKENSRLIISVTPSKCMGYTSCR